MIKNGFVGVSAPISVNLEVTDKCNLSCFFCFNIFDKNKKLETRSSIRILEDIIKILDALVLAGVFEIRLFGGEFTIFKYWREILSYIYRKRLFISFVSNGYLISPEDVELFYKCGVRECTISLHGLEGVHDEIARKKGSYARAVNSINGLLRAGIQVSVVITPNKKNDEYVFDFVKELHHEHGVKNFGVNRLFVGSDYENLTLNDYLRILDTIDRCCTEMSINMTMGDSIPRCVIPVKYWKYLSYCSKGVTFAQVDNKGNIKHCASTNKVLGNVLNDEIKQLWRDELATFRELRHLPISCRYCPVFCGGGCVSSRSLDGGFLPDQFVPLPEEEGLLNCLCKLLKLWFRKYHYKIFYNQVKEYENKNTNKIFLNTPRITERYKIRKEDDGLYLAMFERSGVKTLTPLAVEVLEYSNGQNTVQDIVTKCKHKYPNCEEVDIKSILQELYT